MRLTKRQLRRIIRETAAGRRAARDSMMRNIRSRQGEDMDFIDELQRLYPDIDEIFNGGWDEDAGWNGEWVVMDEVEGQYVDSGVSDKGPIGKLKAYHAVNSREQRTSKAQRMGDQAFYGPMEGKITKRQLKRIIREEKSRLDEGITFTEHPRIEELFNLLSLVVLETDQKYRNENEELFAALENLLEDWEGEKFE